MVRGSSLWCLACNSTPQISCAGKHSVLSKPEDTVEYLIAQARDMKLALMCGAGISSWAPTSMPPGDELKESVLRGIGLENTPVVAGLSLEHVMSKVGWGVESCLAEIFEGRESKPNLWHHFVARLMKNRYVTHVFTTNFDQMIEAALTGWKYPDDYLPVTNEQYKVGETEFTEDQQKPTIWHLHGTYRYGSMCVTTSHVQDPDLATTRIGPLAKYLESAGHTLLLLGYSARDLDVKDVLQNRKGQYGAVVVSLGSTKSGELPAFRALEGCFGDIAGFRVTIRDYVAFVEEVWNRLRLPVWSAELRRQAEKLPLKLWTNCVQSWRAGLPDDVGRHVASRMGAEIKVAGAYSGSTTIKLGKDEIRIAGDCIFINVGPGDRFGPLYAGCSINRGILRWDLLNRRLRAAGYLHQSRHVEAQEDIPPTLCSADEKEALHYIDQFVEETKQSRAYRELSNYREFVDHAGMLLTRHDFLHSLTQS